MKIIENHYDLKSYSSKVFDMYFGGLSLAVFDIETTGLFPFSDKLILSGILSVDNGSAKAVQIFADSPGAEADVISATLDILSEKDVVVTYNGRAFDIPFLIKRAKRYDFSSDLSCYDLDLYSVIKGHSPLPKALSSLSQTSIENYMGLADTRLDQINGRESVELYKRYLVSGSPEMEEKILLHNHDDIMQLYRLLPVLSSCDLHRAMHSLGFPVQGAEITGCKVTSYGLEISARSYPDIIDYVSFPVEHAPYRLLASASNGEIQIMIPAEHIGNDASVIDAAKILKCGTLRQFNEKYDFAYMPAFESGYLVLKANGCVNHMEINLFIKAFFDMLAQDKTLSAER